MTSTSPCSCCGRYSRTSPSTADRVYVTGVSTAKAMARPVPEPGTLRGSLIVAGLVRPKLADGSLRNDPDPVVPRCRR